MGELRQRLFRVTFPHALAKRSILGIEQLSDCDVESLMDLADFMQESIKRHEPLWLLNATHHMKLLFSRESASTRTRGSFVRAMAALGGSYEIVRPEETSLAKGEPFRGTAMALSTQADIIIMRHHQTGEVARFAKFAKVPVINAGDGNGEHPTQALLDFYTIRHVALGLYRDTVGRGAPALKDLLGARFCIVLAGDLVRGRTVHSLAPLLSRYKVRFILASHPKLRMPPDEVAVLRQAGCRVEECDALEPALEEAHILYMTRDQNERPLPSNEPFALNRPHLNVTPEMLARHPKLLALMHPLPHGPEISEECYDDPRSLFQDQEMRSGVYVRMALLAMILDRVPR